ASSRTPRPASFLRVVRVWQRRASSLRCWVYFSSAMAASRINRAARLPKPHERTKAAAAVLTWQTVSSGFFPPEFLVHLRQEQVAYRRNRLMPFQPQIRPPLEVVETQFGFLVLEAAFDAPA